MVSAQPHEDYDVTTVSQLVSERAASHGDRLLLLYQDEEYTYGEIDEMANRIAGALAEDGVEKGDTIATFLYNSPEYLALWFGIAKLGAVMVPINVSLKADGLSYMVNDSQAEITVLESETRENYETARDDLDDVTREYLLGEDSDEYRSFDELLFGDPDEFETPEIDVDDPMCIIYTSGTTGLPKGVVLPHYSYINTGSEFVRMTDLDTDDRPFTTLPLFHCNAQQLTVMGSMLEGTSFALERWFSASSYWDQIRKYDATIFNYLGTMISVLNNQEPAPDDADNPAVYGVGAAAPAEIVDEFEERFDVELVEGYGLTETGTVAIFNERGEENRTNEGSIGVPVSYADVTIVDEKDRPVPVGEVGEIVVRPTRPNCFMLGYFEKPDKTVEDWQNLWFHTGDLGYQDENGYFYFVDRKAYSIRRRGENIATQEVEQVINDHPAVDESAVVGVPSELGEEDVKAYAILQPDRSMDSVDVVEQCESRLAYFKVPRYVEFVDSFPKTATERVEKYKLKERGIDGAWDRKEAGYELDR
ncbi:ATP-dependent acyl-CoA ligase [Natronococcus pandeyae]|uniref:ATP-dependent acyl-CoA ligase n=1 Tax=Natronococcus pandeyae TaxID=2055836 RepID=A0A8J8Q0R9_9EURY|nr:ATP-dependent acyl-CoA ligase [Natronococcus pandeyae]TYL37321.1 ATP-dependent acyl-CoA ligase [Natronococcus pandeyae]